MTRISSHGSDAVTESRNEKPQQVAACWGVFVDPLSPTRWPNFLRPVQRIGVTFERCMDGIGILQRRP